MKCWQRTIREMALPEPEEEQKKELARKFCRATVEVRQITYAEAKPLVLQYEWLGTMGSARWCFGLFIGPYLAGVEVFGTTAGNRAAAAIAGPEYADRVCTLVRGCCLPWADHPVDSGGRTHTGRAASFLISRACKLIADQHGKNIVVAYSDPQAGEIGTIYQSVNAIYTGTTSATEQYRSPDGKLHDTRQLSGLTRDRRRGGLAYIRSRNSQRLLLLQQGAHFVRSVPKHRYLLVSGNRTVKRILRAAIKLPSLPYPKRELGTICPEFMSKVDCHPSTATGAD
ncbi:hypothetical protein [Occallatibacter savannae]|uniref:Mom family adenine methylcarbamoylation protein n=1 Tax=Occallatibacter savannae TaxID=1002691 RepID=UPI000D68A7DF|nr:hypothetical protein [Occallatibacter savannae]